jgi:hypothetical protein
MPTKAMRKTVSDTDQEQTKHSTKKKFPKEVSARKEHLRLFISHKVDACEGAREIAKKLRALGKGALEVFISEELPYGLDWLTTLHRELDKADKLVLLYTDPDQQWDWCLYESGFFRGRASDNAGKSVIVFHDIDVPPPAPLQHIQNAAMSERHRDGIQKFIQELFTEPVRPGVGPLLPEVVKDGKKCREVEDLFIHAVSYPREQRGFANEICVQVKEDALKGRGDMPSTARVFGSGLDLLALDRADNGHPWKLIYEEIERRSDNPHDWVRALVELMRQVTFSPNRLPSTGLPLFRCRDGGRSRVYRPAIRSYTKKRDILSFHIIFVDLPEEAQGEKYIGSEASLAYALAISRMFRWSVLEPLAEHLRRLRKSAGVKRADVALELHNFFNQISTVYAEGKNQGYGREQLEASLEERDQTKLQRLLRDWDLAMSDLRDWQDELDDPTKVSEEFTQHEFNRIEMWAEMVLMINKAFLVLCTKRYLEILDRL